jgi:hypothetical protein
VLRAFDAEDLIANIDGSERRACARLFAGDPVSQHEIGVLTGVDRDGGEGFNPRSRRGSAKAHGLYSRCRGRTRCFDGGYLDVESPIILGANSEDDRRPAVSGLFACPAPLSGRRKRRRAEPPHKDCGDCAEDKRGECASSKPPPLRGNAPSDTLVFFRRVVTNVHGFTLDRRRPPASPPAPAGLALDPARISKGWRPSSFFSQMGRTTRRPDHRPRRRPLGWSARLGRSGCSWEPFLRGSGPLGRSQPRSLKRG